MYTYILGVRTLIILKISHDESIHLTQYYYMYYYCAIYYYNMLRRKSIVLYNIIL